MNWLARLEINAETVHSEGISNDIYSWHKLLWECYPDAPDAKRDFLTRIDLLEGRFRLWVMAKRKPSRPHWCPVEGFSVKEIARTFLSHRHYVFDLRANPTKCLVRRGPNGETLVNRSGKRKHGKRVPIVKQDELRAWINKKGKMRCKDNVTGVDVPGGFRIIEVDDKPLEISPMTANHFYKKGLRAYHGGVQFRGILEVVDQNHFIKTYQSGIGSAKGFGFGLLLLSPINLSSN